MSIEITSEGKYLLLFHNQVINCTWNGDCPPGANCFFYQPWAAVPTMCGCVLYTGTVGDTCTELSPYWGQSLMALSVLTTMAASLVVLLLTLNMFLLRKEFIRKPFNAFTTTFVFTLLAAIFVILSESSLFLAFDAKFLVIYGNAVSAGMFFFVSLSGLNVSLLWCEIALQAKRMSTKIVTNVQRYRAVLVVYYLIFFVLACYYASQNNITNEEYVALPGTLFVAITYLVAFFRIRHLYLQDSSSSSNQVQVAESSAVTPTNSARVLLSRIAQTSLIVSICCICGIICYIVLLALQLNGIQNLPGYTPVELCARLALFFLTNAVLAVSIYLHKVAQSRIKKKAKSPEQLQKQQQQTIVNWQSFNKQSSSQLN